MDERDFKKHLRDLVHGHHNPAEHDWGSGPNAPAGRGRAVKKQAPRARKRRAKS